MTGIFRQTGLVRFTEKNSRKQNGDSDRKKSAHNLKDETGKQSFGHNLFNDLTPFQLAEILLSDII